MVDNPKEKKNMSLSELVTELNNSVSDLLRFSFQNLKGDITDKTTLVDIIDAKKPGNKDYINNTRQGILEYSDLITEAPHYQGLPEDEKEILSKKIIELRQIGVKLGWGVTVKDELPKMSQLSEEIFNELNVPSDIDKLTGLKTLHTFEISAGIKIGEYLENPSKELSFVFMDLNNFKKYNDVVSHDQADTTIKVFTSALKNIPGIITGRRSGDEFFLLMHNPDAEGAKTILETRLIPYLETRWVQDVKETSGSHYDSGFEDAGYKLSVSAGITSTRLPQGRSFYQRLGKYIRLWYKDHKDEYPDLDVSEIIREASLSKKEPGHDINKALITPENRTQFRNLIYSMMINEAERAMHLAKKQRNPFGENIIAIYDSTLPKKDYVYEKKIEKEDSSKQ